MWGSDRSKVKSWGSKVSTSSIPFHSKDLTKVLCMLFDKFLLAGESRDLSQADKSIIRVSSFPKMSDG